MKIFFKIYTNTYMFLIGLLLISLIPRIIFSFLYIRYPDIPHDFPSYIEMGKFLIDGTIGRCPPFHYGVLTTSIYAVWIKIFGENYFLFKFLGILFDSMTLMVVFYVLKKLINEKAARLGGFFYAFSYLTIYNSGMSNDTFYILFMVLSIFLLVIDRYILASISLGIGIGFGIPSLLIIPASSYYIYRKWGLRRIFTHLGVIGGVFLTILLPFYYVFGQIALRFSSAYELFPVCLYSPLNFIRLLIAFIINAVYFLYTHTVIPKELNPIPGHIPHPLNIFFTQISQPIFILGYILVFFYMFKFKLQDKKLELIRNTFLMICGTLVFARMTTNTYYTWLLPFLLILILYKEQISFESFSLKIIEIWGIILTLIGLLIFSILYRWNSNIPEIQRVLISLVPLLVSYGTYLMLFRSKMRKSWAILMFGSACFDINGANPFLIFKPFLIKFIPETPISFGTYLSYATLYPFSLITLGIGTFGIILLAIDMHYLMKRGNYLPK